MATFNDIRSDTVHFIYRNNEQYNILYKNINGISDIFENIALVLNCY